MKKILTLLIAVGAISVTQAQSSRSYPGDGRYETRDVILGGQHDRYDRHDRSYGNNSRYTYSFSARERDRELDKIDREYDRRIRQVQRDRYLRSYERSSQIRRLQEQKRYELAQVWDRFRSSNNRHRDNSFQRNNNRRW